LVLSPTWGSDDGGRKDFMPAVSAIDSEATLTSPAVPPSPGASPGDAGAAAPSPPAPRSSTRRWGPGGHAEALLEAVGPARTRDRHRPRPRRGRVRARALGPLRRTLHRPARRSPGRRRAAAQPSRWSSSTPFSPTSASRPLNWTTPHADSRSRRTGRSTCGWTRRSEGPSAADLVATLDVSALRDIIATWGEERLAGRIARAIVRERSKRPIVTTRELAARRGGRGRAGGAPVSNSSRDAHVPGAPHRGQPRDRRDCRRSSPAPCRCSGAEDGSRSSRSILWRIARSRPRWSASLTAASVRPGLPVCGCGRENIVRLVTSRPVVPGPAETAVEPTRPKRQAARRGEVVMNRTAPAPDRGWRNSALHREADNRYARWVVKLVLGRHHRARAACGLPPADHVLRGDELRHRRPART
jgi:hypothetical protein